LHGQLDVLGGGLTVLGLGLLVAPLIELDRLGPAVATCLAVVGLAALVAFVVVERRREVTMRPPPMIPLRLFGIRAFSVANVVTFVVYGALAVNGLMLTLLLQTELGYTALQAGAATLPVTALLAVLSSRVGALVPRLGSRPLLVAGCTVVAAAFVGMATIGRDAAYVAGVLPWVVLFGLGLALVVAPVTTTVLADVTGEHAGAASGVNNAVARLGGLISVAVLPLVGGLTGGAVGGAGFLAGYARTMWAAALLCLLGAVVSWFGFTARTGRVRPVPL
jgi:Na+/melibiose symporter-like transporter